MDQVKIGRFIAERRKTKGLTQMQLAEMLNITDRAVSKWETGKSMPDSSIMLELCKILGISVTELLCGEVIEMENYDREAEKNLLEMVRQKEEADKKLLRMEIITGIICLIPLLVAVIIVSAVQMEEWLGGVIAGTSVIPLLVATPFMIRIEQTAGYYKCQRCGHVHIPKYSSVFMAMHMGRTRYMKCPECRKWSWQKKVISKD
ncbi:MAG: helix-turn-helix transcriptional regulator [Clostridia bacterium]|nr:helix-turn-helix transcriptional regulator [Clostridia bacterium]